MAIAQHMVNAYRSDAQKSVAVATEKPVYSGQNPCARSLRLVIHTNFNDVARDWAKLQNQSHVSLHQSLEWCKTWSETHGNPIIIIEGRISGTCSFLLPLEIVSGKFGRIARFIGAPFSNINTGLFSSTFEHEADAALLAEIQKRLKTKLSGLVDLVVLANIPPVWRGINNPFSFFPTIRNQNKSYQLPLLSTFEDTLAQINAKRRRKKYRTSVKRLNAVGGYEHVVAADVAEKQALLDLYFQQKAIRFKALGLPDVFKDKETKAFFHQLLQLPSDRQEIPLEIHALRLKACGTVAAIAGLSRKDDHVICQFSSIDETIAADSSPGEFLFYLMIESMQNSSVAVFDFGIGDQLYKRSWCPVETEQRDAILPFTLRGHIAALAIRALVHAKSMIKSNPRAYSLLQKMRSGSESVDAHADRDMSDQNPVKELS